MNPLRLAVAGAGLIGRAHALRIQALADAELVAVADTAPAAQAWSKAQGVPCHSSLTELLAQSRPDGVILATPNALHVSGALECLAAGVATLVEKPVADKLAAAHQLADAVETSGVPMLVGHHRRYSPILEDARQVIDSGALGRLVTVTASATFHKPAQYFVDGPWRTQPGGGPILINLIHEIDNLRTLMGEIVEVQALGSNAVRGHVVEDTVAISLRFASGALGNFMLSDTAASPRSWEQTSGENEAFDHHADQDCYLIAGTHGSLQVPTFRLLRHTGAPSWSQPLQASSLPRRHADPLVLQLAHFCAVIRGEQAPRVTVRDAARTLAVTLAVAEAVHSGCRVVLK
jgi:predicted dehydrogenase